ncbi:MAG: beta-lactamase family protein [Rhodobacteraceae bacterium]|nr:beta-lactamase family protein [Paracoccaceae bacterium]
MPAPWDPAIRPFVENGALAGAATLVWKDGAARVACLGLRDLENRLPVERDTLFRIASMTKPVTSVLALILRDEGRLALEDPITRWAPEFAAMRVLRDPDGALDATEPAARTISIGDLLTHRSGLTYGDFHLGPIAGAYRTALGPDIDSPLPPDGWIAALAGLPLIDQPGRNFHYGKSTDLLGMLIERIEGAPLAEVMKARVFEPLGMRDTGFAVPEAARGRRAGLHGFDAVGRLTTLAEAPGGHARAERPDGLAFCSGGQGLWSTLDDYLAFARLFVEGGASGGRRLLGPGTMALMRSNALSPGQRAGARLLGQRVFAEGHGFGLGVAVVMEPERGDPLRCGGSAGSVGWPGAYGSWWQADPNDGTVRIFLSHSLVTLEQLTGGVGLGVWGAIAAFQAAGITS